MSSVDEKSTNRGEETAHPQISAIQAIERVGEGQERKDDQAEDECRQKDAHQQIVSKSGA